MSSSGAELCLTLPYHIDMTITRLADAHPGASPIVWYWTVWDWLARGRFVLLHEHAPGQLEPVEVGVMDGLVEEFYHGEEDEVPIQNGHVSQFSASPPNNEINCCTHLTANYQTKLIPGEQYHLFWPGGEINIWDWGTKEEHAGQVIRNNKELPMLALLPAAGIVFKAIETNQPYPDRAVHIKREGSFPDYDWANYAEELWRLELKKRQNVTLGSMPDPITLEQRM